jgi:hypothetical protein
MSNPRQQTRVFQQNVNFTITLTAGGLAIVFSIISIIIYGIVDKWVNWKEIVSFSITTIGVSAGITSAIYVAESIKNSYEDKQEERSFNYIAQWNSPDFQDIRKPLIEKLRDPLKGKDDEQEIREIVRNILDKEPEVERHASQVLNFLEEVATAILKNYSDEEILKDFFIYIFYRHELVLRTLIEDLERQKSSNIWENFLKINKKWNYKPVRRGV